MGTIEEVIDDVTEVVKDNKGLVLGGVVVIVLIVLLTKNNTSNTDNEEYQLATSYSSYPDAVTNANTIIDSLQGSIDASDLDMKEFMSDNFTVAKDYISDGLDKVIETNNKYSISRDSTENKIFSGNEKPLPGVSPLLFTKFLLENAVFISLSDMDGGLPGYEEIPLGIDMDNELIQQILNAVVEGLLPVIMALITLASYYLVKLIYTKTNQIKNEIKDEDAKRMLVDVSKIIADAILATNGTIVKDLKENGKLTDSVSKKALESTVNSVKAQLNDEAKQLLESKYVDIDVYLQNQIESQLQQLNEEKKKLDQ